MTAAAHTLQETGMTAPCCKGVLCALMCRVAVGAHIALEQCASSLLARCRFLVKSQEYVEALEAGDIASALKVLRTQLAPLAGSQRTKRLHDLAGKAERGGGDMDFRPVTDATSTVVQPAQDMPYVCGSSMRMPNFQIFVCALPPVWARTC